MKTVVKIGAAALALSLMTSAAAFAQADQTNATPGMGAPPATDAMPATGAPAGQGAMSGSSAMDSQSGGAMAGQGGATAPNAMGTSATDQGGMSARAAETADTPAGSPPSTYPVCKHKGEDRCMQEASLSGSHHMKHHMMKSKTSKDTTSDTSGAAAPATPPAPGQ